MKKTIVILAILVCTICANAQKDVTQFLGIPVDGSKEEMVKKIKSKGFKKIKSDAGTFLTGRFNDRDVMIDVVTNRDKVYRVVIWDTQPLNERQIRILYNNLCHQLQHHPRYIFFTDMTIPDKENIYYEMYANKKDYQANFYQLPTEVGDSIINAQALAIMKKKLISGELDNLSETERKDEIKKVCMDKYTDVCENKQVWFTIHEQRTDRYFLVMYYDNVYNKDNGKDL